MKRHLIILFTLLGASLGAAAQDVITLRGDGRNSESQVSVRNLQVSSTPDRTILTMDFVLDSLVVPSNRYRAFTPVIKSKDGQHEQRLKTLIVSGRRQNIVFERDGIDPLYADNCDNVRRQGKEPQEYAYTDAVTLEPWHRNADIYVECDLCGCGDLMKNEQALLRSLQPATAAVAAKYNYVNAVPAPSDKVYNLHGSAYITFVVDRWEMKPDYMDNRRELRKITDTLDIMAADKNMTVHRIKIHGWASPESPYEHNRMLAMNRAKSLTDWLKQNYQLPSEVFAPAEATPENWEGLRKAVEEAGDGVLAHRQEILRLIDDKTLAPDPKEWRMKVRYPEDYRYLLREVYPGLRRSDYDITFDVRKFNLEESQEVYKTQPYRLSLRELWDVAHTFKEDSDEYNRALQMAYNLYPDSTDAVINLANVALKQDDLLKAETLLQHAGESAEAWNARAILYMKQHKLAEAEDALERARQKGMDVLLNRTALEVLMSQEKK